MRPFQRVLTLIALTCILPLVGSSVSAQESDSTITRSLDPIVITAERTESPLSSSTGSVSVLSARQLEQLPTRSLVEALSHVPGLLFLDNDGMGWNPQMVTRGFYGGGEAEYGVVLIDGIPVNNLENGLVNWEQLMQSPGTTIEVLRGGASSLYGDAAIGAVINIRTDGSRFTQNQFTFQTGSHGRRSVKALLQNDVWSATADLGTSDGYRDHSGRASVSFGLQRHMNWGADGSIVFSGKFNDRKADLPGPIRSSDEGDRTESLSFFRFDEMAEQTKRAGVRAERPVGNARLRTSLTYESRDMTQVRTLPLGATFADTQERDVTAGGWRLTAQWADWTLPINLDHQLTLGVDA